MVVATTLRGQIAIFKLLLQLVVLHLLELGHGLIKELLLCLLNSGKVFSQRRALRFQFLLSQPHLLLGLFFGGLGQTFHEVVSFAFGVQLPLFKLLLQILVLHVLELGQGLFEQFFLHLLSGCLLGSFHSGALCFLPRLTFGHLVHRVGSLQCALANCHRPLHRAFGEPESSSKQRSAILLLLLFLSRSSGLGLSGSLGLGVFPVLLRSTEQALNEILLLALRRQLSLLKLLL